MRDIFSKIGTLFIVQIDHLNGEIMGSTFEYLYQAGALNVQCLQTITKKNRPGNVFLIDVPPEKESAIEKIIINELDSTGWHKIESDHRHVPAEIIYKDIDVIHDICRFTFQVKGKQRKGIPESVRPEHSSCQELKDKVMELGKVDISLKQIYMKLQLVLWNKEQNIIFF